MTHRRLSFVLLTILLVSLSFSPARALGDAASSPLDLAGRDLRGLDLRGWDLRYADLEGADLRAADLTGARLLGARLREARLDGASLRGADLRMSDLSGVSLRGADLRDADLSAAQVAPVAADAARWSGAICPDETIAGERPCDASPVPVCAGGVSPGRAASAPDPGAAL